MFEKLKSHHGESIGEVLVAMLIVSLGSVMFAGMVMASEKLIVKSDSAYDDYLKAHNTVENYESGSTSSSDTFVKIKSDDDSVKLASGAEEAVALHQDGQDRYFIYEPKTK